jgi:hypothetical protein
MRVSKHTPGPWKVKVISGGFTEDGDIIGEFRGIFPTKELSIPEMKANARLMEASPELYEALECLLDEQNGLPLLNREKQYNKAVETARKALAKAKAKDEGEE